MYPKDAASRPSSDYPHRSSPILAYSLYKHVCPKTWDLYGNPFIPSILPKVTLGNITEPDQELLIAEYERRHEKTCLGALWPGKT